MRDAFSPEEVENATFSGSLRGYDKDEVDAFLKAVASDLRESEKRSAALYETLGEEMGDLLQHARDSADRMVSEAQTEAQRLREEAQADATRMRTEAADEARTTKEASEASAAHTIDEANKSAEETRARAERDATARIAETEERVRALESNEASVRERVQALRLQLVALSDQLEQLETTTGDDEAVASGEEKEDPETTRTIELQPKVEDTVGR